MLLIGINNGTDQGVTHDIPVGKITHGDAGHGLEGLQGLDQAGAFIRRKINLGDVPGDLEFMPMRVSNMNICSVVAFCASSRMTKALFRVRPRM